MDTQIQEIPEEQVPPHQDERFRGPIIQQTPIPQYDDLVVPDRQEKNTVYH